MNKHQRGGIKGRVSAALTNTEEELETSRLVDAFLLLVLEASFLFGV